MLERPDKWVDPEVYRLRRERTFQLYMGIHWYIDGNEQRQPNTRQQPKRRLVPELQHWLDNCGFPHSVFLKRDGRSRVIFDRRDHAMLFKLTWT